MYPDRILLASVVLASAVGPGLRTANGHLSNLTIPDKPKIALRLVAQFGLLRGSTLSGDAARRPLRRTIGHESILARPAEIQTWPWRRSTFVKEGSPAEGSPGLSGSA